MPKKSAGIVLYRFTNNQIEFLLLHPGGPFWAKKDLGAWSIPKGEFDDNEDPLTVAKREFTEETGKVVDGDFVPLTPQKQKSGKTISAWSIKGDIDASDIKSNSFEMEWPPKSGKKQMFPEVDKAEWFSVQVATQKISQGQLPFINEVLDKLGIDQQSSTANETKSDSSQMNLF